MWSLSRVAVALLVAAATPPTVFVGGQLFSDIYHYGIHAIVPVEGVDMIGPIGMWIIGFTFSLYFTQCSDFLASTFSTN